MIAQQRCGPPGWPRWRRPITVARVYRVVIGTLSIASASPALAQVTAVAPGKGFEVERYAVALRPDLITTAVSGTETIVLRATVDRLERIVFSPNALRISAAKTDGAPVTMNSGKAGIVFTLPRAIESGRTVTLRFAFDGVPARGVTSARRSLYTSYFACDWMICLQDAPGDKADLALDLFLPAGAKSMGVGRERRVIAARDGLMLHRWRSTRPYSPYLYAFAAGDLTRTSQRSAAGDLVYIDAAGGGRDLRRLFARTPGVAAFLANKAGMPLPDRRYVQILVPGDEAQEAASFSLIGKSALDRDTADPASGWIVAHEMAHQWWGNLITCATWQDFWLNEGIATFMVAAWKEQAGGAAAYRAELDVARRRLDRAREAGFDKPLAWAGKYPSLGTRRAIQYGKGALFLAHLRETIGDAMFWDGLRAYTRHHAGGTVTSRDFEIAMEHASGRNLGSMFAEWVYGTPAESASADR